MEKVQKKLRMIIACILTFGTLAVAAQPEYAENSNVAKNLSFGTNFSINSNINSAEVERLSVSIDFGFSLAPFIGGNGFSYYLRNHIILIADNLNSRTAGNFQYGMVVLANRVVFGLNGGFADNNLPYVFAEGGFGVYGDKDRNSDGKEFFSAPFIGVWGIGAGVDFHVIDSLFLPIELGLRGNILTEEDSAVLEGRNRTDFFLSIGFRLYM